MNGSAVGSGRLHTAVGWAAIIFSIVYFVSDVIELVDGGFSRSQLVLTYVAEAAIPIFVMGLYVVQRPAIRVLGLAATVAYAYSFVFFTSTVVYALIEQTPDWDSLSSAFAPWIDVHSALMVVSGAALGVAVIRARVMPRWTGVCLIAGHGLHDRQRAVT